MKSARAAARGEAWSMKEEAGRERERASPALWRDVKARIERDIVARRFRRDEPLPSERLLAKQYGVHRHTVRRAMAELEADGLVSVQQGRGTFIESEVLAYRIGRRVRFTENAIQAGFEPEATLLGHGFARATAEQAKCLGLRPGARLVVLNTLRRVGGRPVSYATHQFPPDLLSEDTATPDGLARLFETSRSITAVLTALGVVDYLRLRTEVSGRMPDTAEARILEISTAQPILVVSGTNVRVGGGPPILFTMTRMPTLRVQLVFEADTDRGG
jgi:GntR family phosphonate transport system transcriptional regulator